MLPKFLCKPLQFLRASDPGLLRLTQATKTLLAVLIALDLFWQADRATRLFAAMGAAFFMQCVPAGTRRRKQASMLIAGLSIAALVGLVGALHEHRRGQALLLVGVATLVFWVRRFLPDKNMFPVFGFTLCLIAVELPPPAGSTGQEWREMLALGASVPIAFAMYFFVLPPGAQGAVEDELRLFCGRAARLLQTLSPSGQRNGGGMRQSRPWIPTELARMLSGPDAVRAWLDGQPDNPELPRLRALQRDQYAALEAILVLEGGMAGLRPPGDDGTGSRPGASEAVTELERHLSRLAAGFRPLAGCFEPQREQTEQTEQADGPDAVAGVPKALPSPKATVRESAHLLAARLAIARLDAIRQRLGRELAAREGR